MVLLPALSLLVMSCSQQKTISREELRSNLRSATSIANETELSIDFVMRKQVTHNFAAGHFRYLGQELAKSTKEFASLRPERGLEQNLKNSGTQLDALAGTLQRIPSEIGDPQALTASKKQVGAIRRALEHETSLL